MPPGGLAMLPEYERIELKAAELAGWTPVVVLVEPGSQAKLLATHAFLEERGPLRERRLAAEVLVTTPGGDVSHRWVFVSRAGQLDLTTLRGLGGYVRQLAPHGDMAQFADVVDAAWESMGEKAAPLPSWKAADGPRLSLAEIQDFLSLNDLVRRSAHDGMVVPKGAIEGLLDIAYRLGREVREAEFPSDLQRGRAAIAGAQRAEAAQKWWEEGAVWAQSIVDAHHRRGLARSRLSRAALAEQMLDRWGEVSDREGWPARVKLRDLDARLLRIWIERGWVTLDGKPAE